MKTTIGVLATLLLVPATEAQHPGPQPRPGPSIQTVSPDGSTTTVETAEGLNPSVDPIVDPPGANFLMTVESNMFDGNGNEMPNTLPSTMANPYNLHDGPVLTSPIDPTSPTQELDRLLDAIAGRAQVGQKNAADIQRAIDILEGNPLPDVLWSGYPLLHYTGPEKVKAVQPILDGNGNTVGGNVDVHQIWYDGHIESDTAFLDPSAVQNVTWTITYTVDVLHRAHDDFSPFTMYFDDPALTAPNPPLPHVAMDQTFFPMNEGTRYVFKIKMSLGKYYNLTYTWGWRVHPPRVQVMENALKKAGGKPLPQWEIDVFGPAPTSSPEAQRAAISMISDMAPAKRMWRALRTARATDDPNQIAALMDRARLAYDDWLDRTRLPSGLKPDPQADLTLFYANNTIYGEWADGRRLERLWEWRLRPGKVRIKLLNGDYYPHGYVNVDFGGSRGWENQFHSTVPLGGSGCWFSFGRVHWWINAGGPWGSIICPPASAPDTPGEHLVDLTLNFEPSRRLRMYQFDPLHHEVAVFSIH